MNKTLKTVIDGAIRNEFNYTQEGNLEGMKDINKYDQLSERCNEIQHILNEHLSKEFKGLLEEFDCKSTDLLCLEIRYYFRKGVIAGLTNLNFLKEVKDIYYIDGIGECEYEK
ncbi:hypothetical protein [Clostridium sp. AWRP]|uniref:hypothetical protein n=1 Tax=Clostridium sp. AWRP TaxID=2212991 RepID=UPI000FDCA97A|nr:hypothetical protein [Clostridium sp. AWRP]AZV58945.1 hypothetical protein DMR38_21485 [Clostridium sp. AWRP]